MANSLRRPLPLFTALRFAPPAPRRCFSQSPLYREHAGQRQRVQRPPQPHEKSMRVLAKEGGNVPTDVGLLEGTFVTPTGTNAPSFFKEFGVAFQMLKKRIKFRFRDRISLLALKWSSPQGKRWYHRSLKLTNSKIAPTAVALHRQMYSDFAAGDTAALRKICLDGINDSFRARIGARARGEKVVWELVKYNGRARVISNRGARLPFDGVAIRQAVVRIASRQKLTRWAKGKSGSLEIVPGSGKEKDVVEYVVVQQKFENWKGGSWQVWGTTTETTPENVVQWETKELA